MVHAPIIHIGFEDPEDSPGAIIHKDRGCAEANAKGCRIIIIWL